MDSGWTADGRLEGPDGERPEYRTAYACEGSTLSLECEAGHVIHLIRANYGRFSIAVCNDHGNTDWSVSCTSPRSLNILNERCGSVSECTLHVSSEIFGDPCPGTHKYIEVHFSCAVAVPTTPTSRPRPPLFLTPKWLSQTPTSTSASTSSSTSTSTSASTSASTTTTTTTTTSTTTSTTPTPSPSAADERPPATTPHGALMSNDIQEVLSLDGDIPQEEVTTLRYEVHEIPEDSDDKFNEWTEGAEGAEDDELLPEMPSPSSSSSSTLSYEDVSLLEGSCAPREARNLSWNWTVDGKTAAQPCPGGATGLAKWHCQHGTWSPESPDLSLCKSLWLTSLQARLTEGESASSVANDLAQVTLSKGLYGGDTLASTGLIRDLAQSLVASDSPQVSEVLAAVVKAGSHLLGKAQRLSWFDLSLAQQRKAITQLLVALEENAFLLANSFAEERRIIISKDHILTSVQAISAHNFQDAVFPGEYEVQFWSHDPYVSIRLPAQALLRHSRSGLTKLVFFLYDGLEEILQGSEAQKQMGNGKHGSPLVLNSKVVSASLGEGRHIELPEPATIVFTHLRQNATHPSCVFWDYTQSWWSDEGCRVVTGNATHTECECNHLTNFALLMEPVPESPLESPNTSLNVMLIIGCVVTCLCLGFAVASFWVFRSLRSNDTAIYQNLCICTLVVEILFVSGGRGTGNVAACSTVAGLLHFFFLCVFFWMFFLAFNLYLAVVRSPVSEKSHLKWFYAISYACPALIVAISCIVDPSSYGTASHCWLRADNYFIFSFIGPLIFVLVATIAALGLSTYSICSEEYEKSGMPSKMEMHRPQLRNTYILFMLLSLTWTFGLVYLYQESPVIVSLFTALNILLGIYLCLITCACNEAVQSKYRDWAQYSECLPLCFNGSGDKEKPYLANNTALQRVHTQPLGTMPPGAAPILSLDNSHLIAYPVIAGCNTLPHTPCARITVNQLESVLHGVPVSHPQVIETEEYSTKSLGHDSGHGSSEQEDSPHLHTCTGSLRHGTNNWRMVYGTAHHPHHHHLLHHHHPRAPSDDSGCFIQWPQVDPKLSRQGARQRGLIHVDQHGRRHLYVPKNHMHRAGSPWNHTYTEIDLNRENDPVYAEIDHQQLQQQRLAELSDLSNVSRQSSRSCSDHKPLIPVSHHECNLVDTISYAMGSPKLKSNGGKQHQSCLNNIVLNQSPNHMSSPLELPAGMTSAQMVSQI
ncbi:unnamed protein product [Darwinula stevensoni]|uniref:Latrophilin Cirl n=1 Tax=Darwinula stevensoni TaxID=69355 RepID=A0A7R8X758_9CRUS|nr:unnamed protein product [Darwinula stevensoni]CAG0888741.1 unnamed protein product [Darwinula stevensoni]